MSKFLLFSKHNCKKLANPQKGKIINFLLNYRQLNIVVFALILVLGMAYLGVVNSTADLGFKVDDLKNRISLAKEENQKFEIEISSATSMQNIKRASENMDLVRVNNPEYITGASEVALGR